MNPTTSVPIVSDDTALRASSGCTSEFHPTEKAAQAWQNKSRIVQEETNLSAPFSLLWGVGTGTQLLSPTGQWAPCGCFPIFETWSNGKHSWASEPVWMIPLFSCICVCMYTLLTQNVFWPKAAPYFSPKATIHLSAAFFESLSCILAFFFPKLVEKKS